MPSISFSRASSSSVHTASIPCSSASALRCSSSRSSSVSGILPLISLRRARSSSVRNTSSGCRMASSFFSKSSRSFCSWESAATPYCCRSASFRASPCAMASRFSAYSSCSIVSLSRISCTSRSILRSPSHASPMILSAFCCAYNFRCVIGSFLRFRSPMKIVLRFCCSLPSIPARSCALALAALLTPIT